jgi:cystathionine beta-synthase
MEVHDMNFYNNILETIGNTPLVKLNKITRGIQPTILAKVESFNPGGSVKDRIGIAMIEDAERKGLLKPGGTIVEPTSGNTGIGLAMVAAIKDYKMVFTIPDKMAREKIRILKAYGAEVIVTQTSVPPESPESYYEVAKRIARETPNSFMPFQYYNPANPEIHYRTTGPEIWDMTDGRVDHYVGGMGTGGTISGVGRYLKEQNPDIKIIGADPEGSVYATYFTTGSYTEKDIKPYKVEGIGEDMIPETIHFEYVDEVITVRDKDAFLTAHRLVKEEGIFCGGSSGAALSAALQISKDLDEDAVIVVLFPDTGVRYLSKLYSNEWMDENVNKICEFCDDSTHS